VFTRSTVVGAPVVGAAVDEAVAMIRNWPHAGGGTLVLGDASGAIAAVVAAVHQHLVRFPTR